MPSALAIAEERDTLREENRRLALEKDDLNAKNDELDTKLRELTKKLDLYEEQVEWFKNKLYGRGTEQLTAAERLQIRLFDEIEHSADSEPPEDQAPDDEPPADQAAEVLERTRRQPRRRPLPQWLPRVEQVIDIPEQDKQYLADGLRRYSYYIVVTNSKDSDTAVLRTAQGRGNQENLIKDLCVQQRLARSAGDRPVGVRARAP